MGLDFRNTRLETLDIRIRYQRRWLGDIRRRIHVRGTGLGTLDVRLYVRVTNASLTDVQIDSKGAVLSILDL